jgi:hypothetical protein
MPTSARPAFNRAICLKLSKCQEVKKQYGLIDDQ